MDDYMAMDDLTPKRDTPKTKVDSSNKGFKKAAKKGGAKKAAKKR